MKVNVTAISRGDIWHSLERSRPACAWSILLPAHAPKQADSRAAVRYKENGLLIRIRTLKIIMEKERERERGLAMVYIYNIPPAVVALYCRRRVVVLLYVIVLLHYRRHHFWNRKRKRSVVM